jgi:hypothetical protein
LGEEVISSYNLIGSQLIKSITSKSQIRDRRTSFAGVEVNTRRNKSKVNGDFWRKYD